MWEKPSDAAAEAAVWSLIADVAIERKDAAKAWLLNHMGPDVAAVKAIANGETVGRASWVESKDTLAVVDPTAFMAYVARKWATEIVTSVNPAFQRTLLAGLKLVEGEAIDKDGEPVPGVGVRTSAPKVVVTKSKTARATVDALLSSGQLQLGGLAEVTGGDPDGK